MKSLGKAPVSEKDRKAIGAAVGMLRDRFPIESVMVFGSKVRGDSDEHSDIDLLVVTSHSLHWREEKDIVDALFDLGMEHDVIFSPLFASKEEWEGGIFREFPIYRAIIEEGALVP